MERIEITGVDLIAFAKKVYTLSTPQGLGFLQAESGGLSSEDANEIIGRTNDHRIALSMDYVKGRACKMHVMKDGDKLFIGVPWYDHSDDQLEGLLEAFGFEAPEREKHNPSCNCDLCRLK